MILALRSRPRINIMVMARLQRLSRIAGIIYGGRY